MESLSPTNAPEVRTIRKWFLVALLVSLALHAGLLAYFTHKKVERFTSSGPVERLVPPPFTVNRVVISDELLKPAPSPDLNAKKPEPPQAILPTEKPTVDAMPADVRLTPNAPSATADLAKAIATEKPRVEAANLARPEANPQVEHDIDSLREQMISKTAPKIVAGKGGALPDSVEGDQDTMKRIDEYLAQSGPLTGDVAPLSMHDKGGNMPGGALFEYDSAKLNPSTLAMLRKIGTLIGRNPRSTFSIEGHTDSFGSPAYNLKLSQTRAEAVKAWLVTNMKLNPANIKTKGFGSSQLIKPATGTREQQAPNRRVEIVITTPRD